MNMVETAIRNEPLFNLNGREILPDSMHVREVLFIADNPLHWKALKLQQSLERMELIAQLHPGQFNAKVYDGAVEKLAHVMDQINAEAKGESINDNLLDTRELGEEPAGRENSAALGAGAPFSVDAGISTDNPFSR